MSRVAFLGPLLKGKSYLNYLPHEPAAHEKEVHTDHTKSTWSPEKKLSLVVFLKSTTGQKGDE